MTLVTTALGIIGREAVKLLAEAGHRVRALVPDQSGIDELAPWFAHDIEDPETLARIEYAFGDFDDPDSLAAAMVGVERAFLITAASEDQVDLQANFVDAAAAAGVRHVVNLSAEGVSPDSPIRLLRMYAATEARLERAGIPTTILRFHLFMLMQNLRVHADSVQKRGVFALPLATRRVSIVDARDIAVAGVAALDADAPPRRSFLLTGPESIDCAEMADRLSAKIGYPARYQPVPPQMARAGMLRQEMPAWLVDDMLALYSGDVVDGADRISGDFEALTGQSPRDFDAFAADYAWAFVVGEAHGQLSGWLD